VRAGPRLDYYSGATTDYRLPDLAQHYFVKANITALRRVRKTDNNRIARATGATIVNRVEDLQESDVGTKCGLFEIEKIGDEYFSFLTKCKDPKACTVLLRGPSKDVLNEIERNLQDAMGVARNVMFHPRLSPGGGATEMAVSVRLSQKAKSIEGVQQWPYKAVADALEVIPRTLVQNAGASPVRVLTELRAKHAEGKSSWGINGDTGSLADMKEYGVWEPQAIKLQSLKTAIEVCTAAWQFLKELPTIPLAAPHLPKHPGQADMLSSQAACLLLRVDDICSAKKAPQGVGTGGGDD
jgi:T-complex protein 1 subunit gamma